MVILDFLKNYWVLICFFVGEIGALFVFVKSIHEGTKCSLRNDILDIYDRCKDKKQITHYQLESIQYSYTIYKFHFSFSPLFAYNFHIKSKTSSY